MDRQAWLQERRKYLGASEVAAVCGLCPFGSPLTVWASKRGILTMQDSPALQMGRLFGLDDLSIADQDAVGRKFDRLRLELQPVEATPGAASYEGWKQNRVERERLILMPA